MKKYPSLKGNRIWTVCLSQEGMTRDSTTIKGEGGGREGLHDGLWKEVST